MTQDLFEHQASKEQRHAPLAERMRPRKLEEFVGQEQLLGPGRLLARALSADRLPSMILWGPPGTGKTALASVIANQTGAHFVPVSAVLAGVKEIREIARAAEMDRDQHHRRTILFLDEIHRLNKAQQDALLPHVERGTFTLVGATTENPSFEVNAALLSRSRVFVLESLGKEHLAAIARRALSDRDRGLASLGMDIDQPAMDALCHASQGDARRMLNTLEAASLLVLAQGEGRTIRIQTIHEAVQHKTLLYDRAGDEHYQVVSAFIKSLRGSDPHAALYWMARMLEAGEDTRFVLRRMVIFASEDIGNADPQALPLAVAALQAHEFVGLPESALHLSQVVCYLACAPKSNSALVALAAARQDVREHGALPVPMHLRNAPTGLMKSLGHGRDYQYPHDHEGAQVAEDYLPLELADRIYYRPSPRGAERAIAERLAARVRKPKPPQDPS